MGPIDPRDSANGIRTRVWALRGPRPSPLDDSAAHCTTLSQRPAILKTIFNHRPGGNRTPNRRFWRPVLYQLSYGPSPGPMYCGQLGSVRHSEFVPRGWLTGIEPATPGATDRCSNQLSYSHHGPAALPYTTPCTLGESVDCNQRDPPFQLANGLARHRQSPRPAPASRPYFARSMYSPVV